MHKRTAYILQPYINHEITIQFCLQKDIMSGALLIILNNSRKHFTGIKLCKALRNIHVADATDAVFTVEVAQDNVRLVRWEKNGVEIVPDGKKHICAADGRKFTLTVRDVSQQDVAAYSFVAGSAKSSGRIYVEGILASAI